MSKEQELKLFQNITGNRRKPELKECHKSYFEGVDSKSVTYNGLMAVSNLLRSVTKVDNIDYWLGGD